MKVTEGRRRYPRKGGRDIGQTKTTGLKLAQVYKDFGGHKYIKLLFISNKWSVATNQIS